MKNNISVNIMDHSNIKKFNQRRINKYYKKFNYQRRYKTWSPTTNTVTSPKRETDGARL